MIDEDKKLNKLFETLRRFSQPRTELLSEILKKLNEPKVSPYFYKEFFKRKSFLTFASMVVSVFLLVIFSGSFGSPKDPFANSQTAHAQIIQEVDRVVEQGFAGELEILAAEDALASEIEPDNYVGNLENDFLP